MTRREAEGQISLLEGCDPSVYISQIDTSFTAQREPNIDYLFDKEDKPIFYTDSGSPVFPADNPEEFYLRPTESRKENPLFLKQQEIDFMTEMNPLFKKICREVLIMQANEDSREIFYIPKDTRLFIEPRDIRSGLYPANSKDRFFVVINGTVMFNKKGKDKRIAYELLPGFSRRISIKSKENDFGESITKPVQIAKDRRFAIPGTHLEGERYFNLTKANVFGDFDRFCDFIKRCDQKAKESKLLRQR